MGQVGKGVLKHLHVLALFGLPLSPYQLGKNCLENCDFCFRTVFVSHALFALIRAV